MLLFHGKYMGSSPIGRITCFAKKIVVGAPVAQLARALGC